MTTTATKIRRSRWTTIYTVNEKIKDHYVVLARDGQEAREKANDHFGDPAGRPGHEIKIWRR